MLRDYAFKCRGALLGRLEVHVNTAIVPLLQSMRVHCLKEGTLTLDFMRVLPAAGYTDVHIHWRLAGEGLMLLRGGPFVLGVENLADSIYCHCSSAPVST